MAEAMACGTPVLASDLPVLREVGGDAAVYRPGRRRPRLGRGRPGAAGPPPRRRPRLVRPPRLGAWPGPTATAGRRTSTTSWRSTATSWKAAPPAESPRADEAGPVPSREGDRPMN